MAPTSRANGETHSPGRRLRTKEQGVTAGDSASREPPASAGPKHDFVSILALTPFMLTRCSSDLRYLFVSEAYARMLGREAEGVVGKSIVEIMGEEGFQTILPHVRKVLQGERVEYEADVDFEGVGPRSLRVIYVPERNIRGEVQGWVGSILDLSDQKCAEDRVAADLRAMTLLRDVGSECVREESNTKQCLKLILETAIEVAGAEKGAIQLLETNSDALVIAVQHGFEEPFLRFFERVRDDHSACSAAMRSSKQVVVDDILESDIFRGRASQKFLTEMGVRAIIRTPLMSSKNNLLGLVSTHFSLPHQPNERELQLLHLLARQAADYLERKFAEEHQKTLMAELDHRVKNVIARVAAIADSTRQSDSSIDGFIRSFNGRIQSMAAAHTLLSKTGWCGTDLAALVRKQLAPYATGANMTIGGTDIMLGAPATQALAMVFHELVTNAVKYGALSIPGGRVSVSWERKLNGSAAANVILVWREVGGPPVTPEFRSGYGTGLIRELIPHELGGTVDLVLASDGACCRIELPVEQVNPITALTESTYSTLLGVNSGAAQAR
jgi:PAS domain S-box-containing protein